MRLNIFSGARRIAAIGGLVAVAATIVNLATPNAYSSLTYSYLIGHTGEGPLLADSSFSCNYAESDYIRRPLTAGDSVSITLCFLGWESTRDPVDLARRKALTRSFKLDSIGESLATKQRAARIRADRLETLKIFASFAIGGWLLVFATGWVVRGFLGIPRGHDFKPDGTSPSSSGERSHD